MCDEAFSGSLHLLASGREERGRGAIQVYLAVSSLARVTDLYSWETQGNVMVPLFAQEVK